MSEWKNLDTLKTYQSLAGNSRRVDLTKEMAGETGAARVARYQIHMAAGLVYSYAAKQVDDELLEQLAKLADE